jgi:hypothetical protein
MECGSTSSADLQIVVMTGRVVWSYRLDNHSGMFRKQVDLESYARGVYLLQIRTDSGREYTERIVTQ